MKTNVIASAIFLFFVSCDLCFGQSGETDADLQYKFLATTKTSTMQKELDEAAVKGYRILVGSLTSGAEMALFLSRETTPDELYKYKLLATTRTGTIQKELSDSAADGYRLLPRTIIAKQQLIGPIQVVAVMERPPRMEKQYDYKLLAITLALTLQK